MGESGWRGTLLLQPLALALVACGGPAADTQWEPAAVRAVARHVDTAHPTQRVVVLSTVGGAGGAELPWGVRQSLTTGGTELGDSTALHDPGVLLLVLDRSTRSNGDWLIEGRLQQHAAADPATRSTLPGQWRVRCREDACTVVGDGP